MENLIIIIPTHNRQCNIEKLYWYYLRFDVSVYICDSSPVEYVGLPLSIRIKYYWLPNYGFYDKILYIINKHDALFYALTPDDDFLKKETLLECVSKMQQDVSYSLGIGKQISWEENFCNEQFRFTYSTNRMNGKKIRSNIVFNVINFWSHYQNILWSVYRKDVILSAFTILKKNMFWDQNFIEFTLGMESLIHGNIFVSDNALNFRELTDKAHWGTSEIIISFKNYKRYPLLRNDFKKCYSIHPLYKLGLFTYCVTSSSLLHFPQRCINFILSRIFGYHKAMFKCFIDEDMKYFISKVQKL